jgi:hypothetical protein
MIVLDLLAGYLVVGLLAAIPFVMFGVAHVLSRPVRVTAGARVLLIPGATLLWPVVLARWLRAGRRR